MRRRLLVTMVGLVVLCLALVGLGTAVVAWVRSADLTERHVEGQVRGMATSFEDSLPLRRQSFSPHRKERLLAALNLDDFGVAIVPRDGSPIYLVAALPAEVSTADLRPLAEDAAGPAEALSTSGHRGETAWAAAVVPLAAGATGPAVVVVATLQTADPLAGTYGWMLLAGLISLAVSALVAIRLSQSLSRPVVDATGAARRIADGYLDSRLDEPNPGRDDEPAELARAINAMATSLERSRGLERQFLLSVSHDLRTPLTSIRGYAEALRDGAGLDPVRSAEVILAESGRLDRLVRDLLELARLDARQFALEPRQVDLAATTADAVEAFAPRANDVGVALRVHDEGPITVELDVDRWAQVVGNLVENGLRYARTTVHVSTAEEDGEVVLRVVDDGHGIAPEDLPHVFERLYVAQQHPRDRESGSGLGLAIVNELVEAMGGTVSAEAAAPTGTTLVVRLSRSDD
ncbi:MAG: ATP-binding protein [Actinomycetota bacterium]|nr:ATP-binding protein [Actinomycetota bacterium]